MLGRSVCVCMEIWLPQRLVQGAQATWQLGVLVPEEVACRVPSGPVSGRGWVESLLLQAWLSPVRPGSWSALSRPGGGPSDSCATSSCAPPFCETRVPRTNCNWAAGLSCQACTELVAAQGCAPGPMLRAQDSSRPGAGQQGGKSVWFPTLCSLALIGAR